MLCVFRSPGGTPVMDRKRKRSTGTGLTPIMTRALKKKFLVIAQASFGINLMRKGEMCKVLGIDRLIKCRDSIYKIEMEIIFEPLRPKIIL